MRATNAGVTVAFLAAVAIENASTMAHADGDAARGELRFADCAACHSLAPGTNNIGPSLAGLFGRRAGTIADFRYSPAMRRSGITWTSQMLDEFIADPQKLVPANRMPYSGMPNAADRADLITYLEKAVK
jgi:cytochrome c